MTRDGGQRVVHTCGAPGCNRPAPYGTHTAGNNQMRCSLHDWQFDDLICFCDVARPNGIGECTNCWRPVARLHPIIEGPAVRRWPRLADQPTAPPMAQGAA